MYELIIEVKLIEVKLHALFIQIVEGSLCCARSLSNLAVSIVT
jgi:hypothetical protein